MVRRIHLEKKNSLKKMTNRMKEKKTNKKSCDRMQTFEHDKTHPFDYTMLTITIAQNVCMHGCFFSAFRFGSSFCIFNLIGWKETTATAVDREIVLCALNDVYDVAERHNWRVEIFPWKCALAERKREWICISRSVMMITWTTTYAYAFFT